MSRKTTTRMTSIKCFHCGIGNIWDLRFSNKTNNQPSWKCDNDENCNFSKRYGQEFSWASWQTMPSQIIRNESTEEKHIREDFENSMKTLLDREKRDEIAKQAIRDSLPRIGRMDN